MSRFGTVGLRRARAVPAAVAGVGVVLAVAAACASGPSTPDAGDQATGDQGAGPAAPPGQEQQPMTGDAAAAKATLDSRARSAPDEVAGWGIDPAAGVVAVQVVGPRTPAVDRFLAGVDPRVLRIEHVDEPPRLLPGS